MDIFCCQAHLQIGGTLPAPLGAEKPVPRLPSLRYRIGAMTIHLSNSLYFIADHKIISEYVCSINKLNECTIYFYVKKYFIFREKKHLLHAKKSFSHVVYFTKGY